MEMSDCELKKLSQIGDAYDEDQRSEDRGKEQNCGAHLVAEIREECRQHDADDGACDPGVAHDQDLVKLASALICCRQVGQRQSRKVWPISVSCAEVSPT